MKYSKTPNPLDKGKVMLYILKYRALHLKKIHLCPYGERGNIRYSFDKFQQMFLKDATPRKPTADAGFSNSECKEIFPKVLRAVLRSDLVIMFICVRHMDIKKVLMVVVFVVG